MSSDTFLDQTYAGEELLQCAGKSFYNKGSVVYALDEEGIILPFYTNEDVRIDAMTVIESVQYLLIAYKKLATAIIDVINVNTKSVIHSYQLPPDVTTVSRMAVSADCQVLAFLTVLPREVLYVMRLNHMNMALIVSQLDLSGHRSRLPFHVDTAVKPYSLSSSHLSTWIGLSFCPQGNAMICISHRVALLITFHFTAQLCYLVARQVGINLRSPVRPKSPIEFIANNYISTISPAEIRGCTAQSMSESPCTEPELALGDTYRLDLSEDLKQCIVPKQYGGSGFPMGRGIPEKLSSLDGDWTLHTEDELATVLQNIYSQVTEINDKPHSLQDLLPLISTYCTLEHNSETSPSDFGSYALSVNKKFVSHFYLIDRVLDDGIEETEEHFLFTNGQRTTNIFATLSKLMDRNVFNPLNINKLFHFTGSHLWLPKQSICLIACRNMGIVATIVPNIETLNASASKKTLATSTLIFPPPPKTAFLMLNYDTNGKGFNLNDWATTSDTVLGLGDGVSSRQQSKYKILPNMPLNNWYIGDRRLMSITCSFYLKTATNSMDIYSNAHLESKDIGEANNADPNSIKQSDYSTNMLLICGFGDSTVKWFSLPLSNGDGATFASNNASRSAIEPIYSHTYASLGPVRYILTTHLTDRSVYYHKTHALYNVVCLCLFSEVLSYLPIHTIVDVLTGDDNKLSLEPTFQGTQQAQDGSDEDDSDTSKVMPHESGVIYPSNPVILCPIVPSLVYRGENLRATHFRSLINIKIMAELERNKNSMSPNAYKIILYALSKYNSGYFVEYKNKRHLDEEASFSKSLKPKVLSLRSENASFTSNFFINTSDYIPLLTVCKPLLSSPFACNTVRNCIAFLSFPVSTRTKPKPDGPRSTKAHFNNQVVTNNIKAESIIHCTFIGTLDCGRLYMLCTDEHRQTYTHYFSCRVPMSILDGTWYVPDPICSMVSLPESKFIVTGHVSGYLRMFSCGFLNADSFSLDQRMFISLVFRIKASELPITHLAASPSSTHIVALDSADNLFILGGPQHEFAVYGFLQLKNQLHLTPQFTSQFEHDPSANLDAEAAHGDAYFGYARASLNFQSYIVEKFSKFILDGESISSLLQQMDETYETRTHKVDLSYKDYGLSLLLTEARNLEGVDVLNPVVPSSAIVSSTEAHDITRDTHKVAQHFMGIYETAQTYTVPVRRHSMNADVLSQNSNNDNFDNEDDTALRQILTTFCSNLRPTYNPFIDDFIPLLFNNTTDLVLTNDCIYISFSTGDILRLNYPQMNITTIHSELNSIVLQNDYDDALTSHSERDLEQIYARFTRIVTENILLSYTSLKPYIIRTGYAIRSIAVDPMCIPPPCSISDLVYVGLEDGRLFCYISKHEVDQAMLSRMSQYIQDTPFVGISSSSGNTGICQMRGPITSLSALHDIGILAATDTTGLTLVMQLCQVTTPFLKRVINQARDFNDMSGPSSAQASTTLLPTQNDLHIPTPHTYGMPVNMVPTTYYYIDCVSGTSLSTYSCLYSNSLFQNANNSVLDANGATISYFSEPADLYCMLLVGTSVGNVCLQPVQKNLVSSSRQYVSTIDAIVKQFLQVQATQESMTISGSGSKAYLGWKASVEQRARARAATLTLSDYQLILKLYENVLTSVSDAEHAVDGGLWRQPTPLSLPLYTHHPMLMTFECEELIAGTKNYKSIEDRAVQGLNEQKESGFDIAIKAIQLAIKEMQSRIELTVVPSYQDVSLRFAAQTCAVRFNSRSKLRKISRLINEVQKLCESCKELEAENAKILIEHGLDSIYKDADLLSLEGLMRAKKDMNLISSEVPSLAAIQSRLLNKDRQASILSRNDSIKSFKASIRELEAATKAFEAEESGQESEEADVDKLLRATARVSENSFRISEDVTLLARGYLLKHMVQVEQYMKATILRSLSYLHMLENQLIHSARQDEIGYAVCGLADRKISVTSFVIPKSAENCMIKARKVCFLRSAQIVSERYSIYAPHVGLQRSSQQNEPEERSHHAKSNANKVVFGSSVLPPPHKSIFTRIMTSKKLPFDETGTLLDFSAALEYSPKTYYYKTQDPFFLEDNRVQVSTREDQMQGQSKDAQDTAQSYLDLPESQTLFSMLQLSTTIFDRAPQIPFAQVTTGESLGFVYPRLPTADVIGSHESLSLRRALFTEAECTFAIRAKQQILLLRAIALLLMNDFNKKLAEERDKKYKIQSRIHDIANQMKDNSKELVYLAKEAALMELIEQERKKLFSDLQGQGIGIEEAASRAAKQAVLGLPTEDFIAQRALESVDIQLLDINTITGYSPGGGDAGIEACESIAIMLGYNPYLKAKQSGSEKSYAETLTESLRTLANQSTMEKTFQTVAEFLAYLSTTRLSELGKTGISTTDFQQAQLNSVSLLNLSLKFTNITNNSLVNSAILTLTDEGLFKVSHLKTMIQKIKEQEKIRNTVANKEVLRLWYSYKRALYDMMRGAIDAANRITVRDIPIPTVYGLDKIPGMKLTKEQEQELEAYNAKIKDLVDKRLKEKRQLEASCKSLREQATKLSLQFDNDRLHTLLKIRFNAELKLQAIQLAVGSLNMRLLDRTKTLGTIGDLSRYEGQLSSETRALNNAELISSSILNRLQQRLVTLRSAEKLYNAGIKRELQDPCLIKYLKQRSNPKITRNALRQYFTTKPDLETAVRELLNTTGTKGGTMGSSTFSASGMSTVIGMAGGSTSSQNTSIPYETINQINTGIMDVGDQQAIMASQQRQALLIESEEEAIRWLAQTHSMIMHNDEGDFRDLVLEVALAESSYFDTQDLPMEIPNLMSLPATENPVLVSLIHKVIPLHGLPNITQLLSQVPAGNHELKVFDVVRCTKLALELQIYETTRLLQETQASVGKLKSENTFFSTKLERHHSDTLALSRKMNAEFVNMPLLILVKEGQVEPSRPWDFAVDRKPLVFGGIRVGIDLERTRTKLFNNQAHRLSDDYTNIELDAEWNPEKTTDNHDSNDLESENILLQDNSSFIVLSSSYIDELNEQIRSLGERRSTVLMNLARFRQQTKIVQHRIDLVEWQRKDAIAQTKDYQLIRVSKEMHEVLRENSSTTEKRSKEVNTVQRKLEHTRKANILANNQLENKINAIPLEIQAIEQQNIAIEARINELRAKNIQRRQAIPEAELNEVEVDSKAEADKKFRRIAALRKMKELSKAQEEELQFLMRELEKLRRRTYPSFD